MWGSGPDDVWAVGGVWEESRAGSGTIAHFDGSEWSVAMDDADQPLVAIWGSSAEDIYAVGGDEPLHFLHFDGSSWEPVAKPPDIEHCLSGSDVWGSGAEDVFVTTFDSVVYFDGSQWSYLATLLGSTEPPFTVWGTSGTNVYVGHGNGLIDRWDGSGWTDSLKLVDDWRVGFGGIWGTGESDIFAVGGYRGITDTVPHTGYADGACIYHFDGARWIEQEGVRGLSDGLDDVWGASATDVWAVGEEGTVLRYRK